LGSLQLKKSFLGNRKLTVGGADHGATCLTMFDYDLSHHLLSAGV
jgi:hypothetical protein